MTMISKIYGHARQRDGEELKCDGWKAGILAVSVSDYRLSAMEREALRAIGERLYGGARGKRA